MTLKWLLDPKLAFCMAMWAGVLGIRPGQALAIPSGPAVSFQADAERAAQIEAIMSVLSRPEAQIHLRAHGLNPGEVREKLARLDDSQLAAVAEKAEFVRSAGILGVIIALLVIAILVVILIFLMDDKEIDVNVKEDKD